MNILYIEHYAGSPEMGMEFRPYYLSREWVKMGHKVTIIAGDYSHLRKKNPDIEDDFQTEIIDGIEYVWLKTGEYEGNGVARAFTMVRFVRKLLKHAKMICTRWQPDVVIASSTYPLDTFPAQKISKIAGCKYIHEFHDLWPATLYEVGGMSKHHPFVILLQIAENSACKHCDYCVSLMPYSMEYLVSHGLESTKFHNLQNGVVEEEWVDYEKIPNQHQVFFDSVKGKTIVGYFGGHALSNALDWSLDLAKELEDEKDIIFVFVGDGVEKNRLVNRATEEAIKNVFFLPPVKKRAIPDLLRHFDCSYMTGMPSPLYRFGLCLNKMYDSMMAGIPIVCAFDAPDTLVKEYNCGFQCSPANKNEVKKAILTIAHMSEEERKEMGKRGKKAVESHFTYEKIAKEFETLMRRDF
ncbi:MAG: glycosyltransferase family 4 protein [Spirochaetales bacterium]|nr:glycosyltransferase family 4 protein [Spirochaetales bacterium]